MPRGGSVVVVVVVARPDVPDAPDVPEVPGTPAVVGLVVVGLVVVGLVVVGLVVGARQPRTSGAAPAVEVVALALVVVVVVVVAVEVLAEAGHACGAKARPPASPSEATADVCRARLRRVLPGARIG